MKQVEVGMSAVQQTNGSFAYSLLARISIRVTAIGYAILCTIGAANPLPGLNEAGALVYIASEQLSIRISPETASLKGVFTFQSRGTVAEAYMGQPVLMDIPIWFPEQNPEGSNITGFWREIPTDDVVMFTAKNKDAFEKDLVLKVFTGNQQLEVKRFTILTTHNDRQRWAPREWQQELGFWCIVPRFLIPNCSALTQKSFTISWRQPLLRVAGKRQFFYLPEFKNLPAEIKTANTNRFSIMITAEPNCSVDVLNGNEKASVLPGRSIVLSPKHHQAIRSFVRPNEAGTISGSQAIRSDRNRTSAVASPRR